MIKKITKWVVVAAIIFSLGLFFYKSDIHAIIENLRSVGFNFIWLIIVTFLAQISGTLSWQSTLPKSCGTTFRKLFLIRYIGEHIGLINPANFVGGDAFKAYQLEKEGVAYSQSISSLLISRLVMIYIQILLLVAVALVYLFYKVGNVVLLYNVIGLCFLCIIVTVVFVILSDKLLSIPFFEKRGYVKRIKEVQSAMTSYYLTQKERFLKAVFWAIITFLIGALEICLICHFIGIDITYLEGLLVDQGVLFLKSFGAFVPGQIGIEEYTNKIMLAIIGISSLSVWLSVSILRRARQIFWLVMGLFVYCFFLSQGNFLRWTKHDTVSKHLAL